MTAKTEKTLLGKLAVKANFITQDQLDEVLEIQKKYEEQGKKVPKLGELLAHKGYLSKEQVIALLKGTYSVQKGLFGEIAQRLKFAASDQVQHCLAIQDKLKANGQAQMPIGQIMVTEGVIRPNQILAILGAQGKTIARCANCGAAYNVEDFEPGVFNCATCEGVLVEVKDLEHALKRASTHASKKTAKPKPALSPGDTYAEFRIESKLGSDALGDLYLAKQENKDRLVLLKIVDPERLLNPAFKSKLVDQTKIAAKLEHPHLQRLIMVGKSKGCYYLANEYLRGETLQDMLRNRRPLDYAQAMRIFSEIADALDHIHQHGLLHLDVRPANVLVDGEGTAKLLGVGLPVDVKEELRWFKSSSEAQPIYMSPEAVSDPEKLDARADLFGLGCTMYHAFTGQAPYRGRSSADILNQLTERGVPSIRKSNQTVPVPTCDLVAKMLSIEPGDRHASLTELKAALAALPKAGESRVAKLDYGKILGEQAVRPPTSQKRPISGTQTPARPDSAAVRPASGERPPSAKSSGSFRSVRPDSAHGSGERAAVSAARQSSGRLKAVRDMNYQELVSELTAQADEDEAKQKSRSGGAKKLVELGAMTGSSYRSVEVAEGPPTPKIVPIAIVTVVVTALGVGGFLFLRSKQDADRMRAAREALAGKSQAPLPAPSAPTTTTPPPEIVKAKEDLGQKNFNEALKLLRDQSQHDAQLDQTLDAAINTLRQLEQATPDWKYLADVKNLLGRLWYYRVHADQFNNFQASVKKDWLGAAEKLFREAARLYGMEGAETQFKLESHPWMPEGQDDWRRRYDYPGATVDYKGNARAAKEDVARYALIVSKYYDKK